MKKLTLIFNLPKLLCFTLFQIRILFKICFTNNLIILIRKIIYLKYFGLDFGILLWSNSYCFWILDRVFVLQILKIRTYLVPTSQNKVGFDLGRSENKYFKNRKLLFLWFYSTETTNNFWFWLGLLFYTFWNSNYFIRLMHNL